MTNGGKIPFAKSCLVGAMALAMLTGCGGGGGGGGSKDGGGDSPGTSPVTVSGAAVKGVILNGVVKIYGVNGSGARGALLAQGLTSSDDGTYSLQVNGYSGPAIVEITALDASDPGFPSLMVCDIPGTNSCYDDADDSLDLGFGDTYPLGNGFALKAVVPAVVSGSNVKANVSALTDLAASQAESTGITKDSVYLANSQVANLFGLMGDITQLPVLDITDADTLNNFAGATPQETESALKAALLSSALLAAAKADGKTIETAIAGISTQFVANGGQLVIKESTDSNTTLLEILSQVNALIGAELDDIDALNQISSNVQNEQATAAAASDGALTQAEPSEENLSSGFLKAKGLVQDLRDVNTAATFEEIQTGATAFADNLSAASNLLQNDTGHVMDALKLVVEAIAKAANEQAQGPTFETESGIVIAVSTVNGVPTYSFDGTIEIDEFVEIYPVGVQLTAKGVVSRTEEFSGAGEVGGDAPWNESGITNISVDLELEGAAFNDAVVLTLGEDSKVKVTGFTEQWDNNSEGPESAGTYSLVIGSFGFSIIGALEQLEGDSPVSFIGQLDFAVDGYDKSYDYSVQDYTCTMNGNVEECSYSNESNSTVDVDSVALTLMGEVTRGEETFSTALTVNATNNGYVQEKHKTWSYFWSSDSLEGSQSSGINSGSEETETAFVKVNFTLDLETSLAGISDDVSVRLTGDRSAFRTGTASLRLGYEGKAIDANLALTGASSARKAVLTIANNQGAVLAITENNIDDDVEELQGVITAEGAQQATVAEENDVVIIRYTGGYVESF